MVSFSVDRDFLTGAVGEGQESACFQLDTVT